MARAVVVQSPLDVFLDQLHPETQALEEVHVGLRALGVLAHQQQQRAAPARRHHRVAAHDGTQRVRLQLLLGDVVQERDVVGRHAQQHLLGPDAALAIHDGQLPGGVLHGVHAILLAQAERHQVLVRATEKAVSPGITQAGLRIPRNQPSGL